MELQQRHAATPPLTASSGELRARLTPAERSPTSSSETVVAGVAAASRVAAEPRVSWPSAYHRLVDTGLAVGGLVAIAVAVHLPTMPYGVAELLAVRVTLKNFLLLGAFAAYWQAAMSLAGVYGSPARRIRSVALARRLAIGCALGSLGAFAFPATSTSGVITWWIVPALFAVTTAGTIGVRAAVRAVTRARRTHSPACRVVLVGSGPRASAMWAELCADPSVRYELVGLFDTPDAVPHPTFAGVPLAALSSLERALMHVVVDQVVIALPVRSRYSEIEATIQTCERAGLESRVPADVFRPTLARPCIEGAGGGTAVVAMHVVSRGGELLVKRAIDVVGAACALIVLSPLLVATALAVRATSPGPALFAQERYGLHKRRFRMYKFRTMVLDAEQQQGALEDRNEASGPVFKIGGDPRVTRLGRFLRRSSIDELPQLWNVLRGDMSLVGPRPLPVRDVGRFDEAWLMRRFSVQPGLTCLWQISGRSTLGFAEWVRLDLKYIDSWSLALDAEILVRTVPAVIKGVGAT